METPDSIYIFTDGDERWYDVKEWEGRTPPPANVEYIRKDALLEWANKQKEEAEFRYNQADMNFVREVAFDDLIDKLNSM